MAKTTYVALRGDSTKAKRLSLAHTERLLYNFRRNTAFQNLKINANTTNFFDESGAVVGTIYMQVVHGAETIVVTVPPTIVSERNQELLLPEGEIISRTVPMLRSTDNAFWVACLGGGFNGPYYVFENTDEVTAEQMDDNTEYELDGELISTGTAPIWGTKGQPDLYFVAQTAKHVTPTFSQDEDYQYKTFTYLFDQYWYADTEPYTELCFPNGGPITEHWIIFVDVDFSYNETFYGNHAYGSQDLVLPRSSVSLVRTAEGPGFVDTIGFPYDNPPYDPPATEMVSFGGSIFSTYNDFRLDTVRVCLELDDISKSAVCAYHFEKSGYGSYSDPYTDCYDKAGRTSVCWGPGPSTNTRKCYFYVDGEPYYFYDLEYDTPSGDCYAGSTLTLPFFTEGDNECICEDNMLKYYGPKEDSDASTGMMCGRIETIRWDDEGYDLPSECQTFLYNYVETGSDTGMITTQLFPEPGVSEHIIANTAGIDDTVRFTGEIFLGRIIAGAKG